ncbi:unnamed protein product [Candida verbasci]|uniref:Uncharacterized protein n=1 Tax=Candida verbasci TaxID=1227364 RepID=A0A9W4TVM5_9ASCO|nr:unnamed protein product [Candida verbasci]
MESKPLPLIDPEDEIDNLNYDNLRIYGYILLISTYVLFIISINSFFELWKFIIQPLYGGEMYFQLYTIFKFIDDMIVRIWCIYIVCWWWAIISWCGLKLFRHSKGIQD